MFNSIRPMYEYTNTMLVINYNQESYLAYMIRSGERVDL